MAIIIKGKTFTSTEQVTSTKLHQLVDSATFDAAAADGSTLEVSAGALRVKDLGVTGAKIADSTITDAKIANSTITGAKFATSVYMGNRNRLINGAFTINQAGLTSVADAAYHLDQWYALTESGNVTIAQQTDQENGQPNSLRMTQPDVTAKRMGSAQPIESINCRDLRGQTVALRARIRCSLSQAIRYAIVEWTGTADTITKDVVNSWTSATFTTGNFFISTTTTIAATGSVTPTANTWTDLLASATISSSANNLIVFIWSEGTLAQNATLDLGAVQLAQGAQTPFEARPAGLEWLLAQRYYQSYFRTTTQRSGIRVYGYVPAGSVAMLQALVFPVPMRTNPTAAVVGTWTVTNCSQPTISVASNTGAEILVTSTAAGICDAYPDSTDDGVTFSARL
jgi:hypothetical protein